MSSFDTRNNSAVMKRAEQLKRWEESDTNREPSVPRNEKGRKIKFSSGCVFLAACLSGDKEEVVKLIESGADINTANVDGLTALHQACIDDNLEMVEFLVEHGADINRQDNEGWTPLHATASCGFVSIARYLVENGADVAAVNSDGDLAVDLAVDIAHLSPMIDYMQKVVAENNVDCEKARQAEELMMLNDAKKWLRSDASEADKPHSKTGATALHVAAAKGYTKVLSLLLAGRANVDKQDNDGWTPLHAASHWGQKEAAEMLVDALADMDVRNYAGQTCIDVAERKMVKFLEELRANNKRSKRRPSSQIRISDTIESHIENTPTKFIRVEVKSDAKEQMNEEKPKLGSDLTKPAHTDTVEEEAPWRRTSAIRSRNQPENPPKNQVPDKDVKTSESSDVILRRTQSFENDEKKPTSPPVSLPAPTETPNTTPVRRSFVPPVRDEESETQRKAHAKRVRETRRSTQGVTLDEIKSAEELVKKKNSTMNNNNNNNNNNSSNSNTTSFKLEDASSGTSFPGNNNSTIIPSAPAVIAAAQLSSSAAQRRVNSTSTNTINSTSNQSSFTRPVSAPVSINHGADANERVSESNSGLVLSGRRTPTTGATSSGSTAANSGEDKENDNRSSLANQTAIQRRRKPKRRSTGVVHLDMDDLDPERQDSANDNDEKESGSERTSRSRLGSSASSATDDTKSKDKTENGDFIDYKALWEAVKLENEKLKQQLKKKDDEIISARATVERFTNAQLEVFKTENQRLKEENGALIRVISKLSK